MMRRLFDALVSGVKLKGSSLFLRGHTTPEGWPFVVVVVVDKTGALAPVVERFEKEIAALAPEIDRVEVADWP